MVMRKAVFHAKRRLLFCVERHRGNGWKGKRRQRREQTAATVPVTTAMTQQVMRLPVRIAQ